MVQMSSNINSVMEWNMLKRCYLDSLLHYIQGLMAGQRLEKRRNQVKGEIKENQLALYYISYVDCIISKSLG